MIILDSVNKSLEVLLGGSVTTNQLPFTVSFIDTNAAQVLTENDGITNNASAVTMISAPAANKARIVKNIAIHQTDTVSATITIRLNNSGTFRTIFKATLSVDDNLIYTDNGGFQVFDLNGNVKQSLLTLPLSVTNGGTGVNTLGAHGVLVGEGASNVAVTGAGSSGQVLTSNGASSDPSFQTLSSLGFIFLQIATTGSVNDNLGHDLVGAQK